ncbi:hypothetical protein K1W54_04900 [Micromonospora sp. CPCC 205371]|nr:hypothetical protein [Micromonospora sp. CPCC 205371]
MTATEPVIAPSDTFCHTVRDDEPCVLPVHDGDVHEDPDGTEYRQIPLTEEASR